MNEKKKKRLFGRILTTVVLAGLLSTTAFAGSPEAQFYFYFPWYKSTTVYSYAAKKTDAGTASGAYADIYATQETKVKYTVVKEIGKDKYEDYSNSGTLYSYSDQQKLSLNYTKYVANNTYFKLRGEGGFMRSGNAEGKWYP